MQTNGITIRSGNNGQCGAECGCARGNQANIVLKLDRNAPSGGQGGPDQDEFRLVNLAKPTPEEAIQYFDTLIGQEGTDTLTHDDAAEIIRVVQIICDTSDVKAKIRGLDALRIRFGPALKTVPETNIPKATVVDLIEDHIRIFARSDFSVQSYERTGLKRAYRRLRAEAGIEKPEREPVPA